MNAGDAGRARAGQERAPGGPGEVNEEHILDLKTTARGGPVLGNAISQHLVFITPQNTNKCGFSHGKTIFSINKHKSASPASRRFFRKEKINFLP